MIHIVTLNTTSAAKKHSSELSPILKKNINYSSLPKYIKKYLTDKLEAILTSEPSKFAEMQDEFDAATIKRDKKRTSREIRKIFRYDLFANKKVGYNAYNLAENLGLNICPYCNREHTITINSKKIEGQLTRPDFDHYLPKSKYPLFALSFYNLIPSCKICNSTFKLDEPVTVDTHLHPYLDNFLSHIEFDYKDVVTDGKSDIEIFYEVKDCKDKGRIEANLDLFKIKEVYNGHKYVVKDLLAKKKELNTDYLELLANNTYKGLSISKEDLYYLAFGTFLDEDDFYKRPFSKLTYDILKKETMLEVLSKT